MESDLVKKQQHGGNLVGHHLSWMVVAVIQQAQQIIFRGVIHVEFMGSHRTALHADAEDFGLHRHIDLAFVVSAGQNLIQGVLKPGSGGCPVSRNIFKPIRNPDIHGHRIAKLWRDVLGNFQAGCAVIDPELSYVPNLAGQSAVGCLGVGKTGWIKINSHTSLPGVFHPFFKVLRLNLVPVNLLAFLKNGVAGVEVDPVFSGNQFQGLVHVRHQFLWCPGSSRVIPCGLNSSWQSPCPVKSHHVVSLPAVHGNRNPLQGLQGLVRIHSHGLVHFSCRFIPLFYCHLSFSSLSLFSQTPEHPSLAPSPRYYENFIAAGDLSSGIPNAPATYFLLWRHLKLGMGVIEGKILASNPHIRDCCPHWSP